MVSRQSENLPYVVIGNSAAGLSACEALRRGDGRAPLILISEEDTVAYSRVATPYFICDEIGDATLFFKDEAYYDGLGITRRFGRRVTAIQPAERCVTLDGGGAVAYGKLLIATGSAPRRPPIAGIEHTETFPHWTLAHAQAIKERTRNVETAAVLGAGFISVLTINAMWKLKPSIKFTVVEIQDQVMPNLLDAPAAAMLQRRMEESGLDVRTATEAVEVRSLDAKKAVILNDGESVEVDMIVMAAGVLPNIDLLENSGIDVQRGVLVDETMRTSQPDVFAAGDCAECADMLTGERVVHAIWPTAVEQGKVAGANMAGGTLRYPGSLSMNVLDAFGMTLTSIGIFTERPGIETITFAAGDGSVYRRVALRDGRLVGMIAAGTEQEARYMGVIQSIIRRRIDLTAWKDELVTDPGVYAKIYRQSQIGAPWKPASRALR